MDYFDSITDRRIDCETADLVDALLNQYLPSVHPCLKSLDEIAESLMTSYPLTILPQDSLHWKRTALAAIERAYPEDAEYLPFDLEERLEAASSLAKTLHLSIFCAEVRNENAGCALYEQQRDAFEARTAGFSCTWHPMPIRICLEAASGYCLVTGSESLSREITCMHGISRNDIEERTPALIAYLRAMYETA